MAERLAGLSLALVTAGAYPGKQAITFQQYLDAYERGWQVDPRRPPQLADHRDRTLYTTWGLTYRRFQTDDHGAARMLQLLAYFDHQELWPAVFWTGLPEQVPAWTQTILRDDVDRHYSEWSRPASRQDLHRIMLSFQRKGEGDSVVLKVRNLPL